MVKRVPAGEGISYGLRHRTDGRHRRHRARSATPTACPGGSVWSAACVLVGGQRRPILGVVTMDQLMIDCGDDHVEVGDEVVLIGRQGDEEVTADEWAGLLDTIAYEVVCGIGPRVPRFYRSAPIRPI